MATWTQLDTAIGRLKIQLVLTEHDTERASYWYRWAAEAIDLITAEVQRANQQARDPVDPRQQLDSEDRSAAGDGGWSTRVVEAGPRRAGERPYQSTGRPTGHGEPAYETTDPAQLSTLPPTTDTTREP